MTYQILLLVAVCVDSESTRLGLLLRVHAVDCYEELVSHGLAHEAPHVIRFEIELKFDARTLLKFAL